MKLMVVLSRVPYPLDKGDKLRAYHLLKNIGEQHDIYLFCITDTPVPFDVKEHLLGFCKEVHFYTITRLQSLLNCTAAIISSKPFQSVYFFNSGIAYKIAQECNRILPDFALFQLIRTSEYARYCNVPIKAIDYMDAFSIGYERMAVKSPLPTKTIYRVEAARLKKYEEEVFAWFNKHIIISRQDRDLIPHTDRETIKVIHNGVNTDYFTPKEHAKKYDLLFHGNMSYMPNVDCALYIANSILPEMKARGKMVSFLVSGGTPNKSIQKLATRENITVTGWIDDVRTSYAVSDIFIAPLQMGTGIQNKLLEAMAMGIPCVVSELAAKALGLKHMEHVLIGNTTAEYCNHIELLWSDNNLKQKLVINALDYVRKNFRWKEEAEKLMNYIAG
jgi:sugar transferase (PEP-CTERM/EpsH1 system associated)